MTWLKHWRSLLPPVLGEQVAQLYKGLLLLFAVHSHAGAIKVSGCMQLLTIACLVPVHNRSADYDSVNIGSEDVRLQVFTAVTMKNPVL
jgi:hypothetical protein